MNYSDIDEMKYLNGILLIQFKNYIQTKHDDFKVIENDYPMPFQKSNVNQILNEDTTIEKQTEEISAIEDVQMNENKSLEESSVDQILNEEIFDEETEESLTNKE